MTTLAVFRPPFGIEPRSLRMADGLTLAQMAARMPGLPADFSETGTICVCGTPAPRNLWGLIKPRPALASGVYSL